MDEKIVAEALVALHTAASHPELVKQLATDIAQPAFQKAGKAAGDLVEIVSAPITAGNMLVKHALRRLEQRLETVPPEKIVSITPELGVPVLQRLSYVTDEVLSGLYIELLARAANVDTAKDAHPSFVHVIENLSPDEGILLQHLRGHVAFVDALLVGITDPNSTHIAAQFAVGEYIKQALSYPKTIPVYVSNLAALGIVEVGRQPLTDTYYAHPYPKIEESIKAQFDPMPGWSERLRYIRGYLKLTPKGELFVQACSIPVVNPPQPAEGSPPQPAEGSPAPA